MNKQRPFYGRKEEMALLQNAMKKSGSSLVVIRGRRRIGKSRLIEEFCKNHNAIHFTSFPPTESTTSQSQLNEFSLQMSHNLKMPQLKSNDWSELFWFLGQKTAKKQWIIVFDEISWMGSKDPDFLGKLKNAWDSYFSKNPRLMLILCGSVSTWIEKNIISHTGFLGRVSVDLVLDELPLSECMQFWGKSKTRIASYEAFKLLSVTGGIPKYLEEIIPAKTAEENIHSLCFRPEGLLFREFEQIFSDLFSKRGATYKQITASLVNGAKTLDEICKKVKSEKSGVVSEYLFDLEEAGFVSADWTWNISTEKVSNLRKYRLRDNYLRFYLKYILPQREIIQKTGFSYPSLEVLPNWSAMMGFQFENLVITNRLALYKKLSINTQDIYIANPFFQRKTARHKGCQIDFMIQTRSCILYLVEIKFSRSKIDIKTVLEMEEKIHRLSLPKGFSIRTVLVHINGVSDEVTDSGIFDFIIDFSEFLKPER